MKARRLLVGAIALSLLATACGTKRLGADDRDGGSALGASPGATAPSGTASAGATASPAAGGAGGPGVPGSSGGGTGGGGGSPVARTASDRGVTKDQILLGVLATDEATFSQFGWTYAGKKHEQVIKPFVDEINAQGGINGRKLVVKVRRYNPLSADERKAACVAVSDDMKAFAAIAPSGFWGDAEICMASAQTPLLTNNNSSRDTNIRREKGWVHQTMMNKDRLMKNWVDWAVSSRTATAATHNGLIYTDVPEDRQIVNEVLVPYMKQRHLQVTEVAALTYSGSPNPDLNQAEGQASVVKFRSREVNLVWPVTNFLQMLAWVEQAEASQYRPKYVVSDFGLMATSGTTQSFPAAQWTGVTGVTSYWGNEVMPGQLPSNAQFKACDALYKRHGLTIGQDPDDATKKDAMEINNMVYYCEHVALFAEVARRAGANPTRKSFIAAFDGLGTWSKYTAMTERLSYKPGKVDGADYYAEIKWQPSCSSSGGCYRTTQGFTKGTW